MGEGKVTAGFMNITNDSKSADELVDASCTCASATEIHKTIEKDGSMKMERVKSLPFKAGETVALKPGSLHIMLMGLKEPLKDGAKVPIQLVFRKAGTVTVEAVVKTQ